MLDSSVSRLPSVLDEMNRSFDAVNDQVQPIKNV